MPKFIVRQKEIHYSRYEVEADNEEQALVKFKSMQTKELIDVEFSHVVANSTEIEED